MLTRWTRMKPAGRCEGYSRAYTNVTGDKKT